MNSNKDLFCSYYIPPIHMHMRCILILHVLEEFEVKQYEDQALSWFLRDYELPLGKCCRILEEAHDHTVTQKTNEGICGYIILIDEHCRDFTHNSHPTLLLQPHHVGMKIG